MLRTKKVLKRTKKDALNEIIKDKEEQAASKNRKGLIIRVLRLKNKQKSAAKKK